MFRHYLLYFVQGRRPVGGKEMEFVNTDGSPITTCQIATESKDVVFGSIFDLDEINTLYNSYSLKFAHNMYVLPGLKTVRINGYLLNETPAGTIRSSQQEGSRKRKIDDRQREGSDRSTILQAEVDALQRQLRKHYSDRRQVALHNEVRRLKKKWVTNRSRPLTAVEEAQNKATYNEIQQAKIRRNAMYEHIIDTKQRLSDARLKLYLIRNEVNPELIESRQQNTITRDSYKGIDKVENFRIDDGLLKPDTVTFSGTDNGLVTMTETVGMSLDRFEFHLKLYNHGKYLKFSFCIH